jgi:hypothetical protein
MARSAACRVDFSFFLFLVMQRVLSVPCWCRHMVATRAACLLLLPYPYPEHFTDTDPQLEDRVESYQGGCNTISFRSYPQQKEPARKSAYDDGNVQSPFFFYRIKQDDRVTTLAPV